MSGDTCTPQLSINGFMDTSLLYICTICHVITFLPSLSGKSKTLSKLTLLCYYLTVDHVRDLTLAVCVWEAPSHDLHSKPTCHLGIFDINCWYHSQMPPSIR